MLRLCRAGNGSTSTASRTGRPCGPPHLHQFGRGRAARLPVHIHAAQCTPAVNSTPARLARLSQIARPMNPEAPVTKTRINHLPFLVDALRNRTSLNQGSQHFAFEKDRVATGAKGGDKIRVGQNHPAPGNQLESALR